MIFSAFLHKNTKFWLFLMFFVYLFNILKGYTRFLLIFTFYSRFLYSLSSSFHILLLDFFSKKPYNIYKESKKGMACG